MSVATQISRLRALLASPQVELLARSACPNLLEHAGFQGIWTRDINVRRFLRHVTLPVVAEVEEDARTARNLKGVAGICVDLRSGSMCRQLPEWAEVEPEVVRIARTEDVTTALAAIDAGADAIFCPGDCLPKFAQIMQRWDPTMPIIAELVTPMTIEELQSLGVAAAVVQTQTVITIHETPEQRKLRCLMAEPP